jgi:ADP-heptose:LPS heptosyltransferase
VLSALLLYRSHLRGRCFDFALVPRWDSDEHLATFLCVLTNAVRRVGYTSKTSLAKSRINCGFDSAFDICLPAGSLRHEVVRNLAIVEALGGKVSDSRLEVRLTDRDRRKAGQLLARSRPSIRLIAIGIGARSPGRRWPLERYAEVLTRLRTEQTVLPVVVCSLEERHEAERLTNLLNGKGIIVSGAPLRQTCAVLEQCALFVGNDSGCAHLAAAMNCPTIVVSRHPRNGDPGHNNSPLRFAPHGNCVRVLQPLTGRDDCKDCCRHVEPHCIEEVSADEVFATARELLRTAQPIAWPAQTAEPDQESHDLMYAHSADAMRRALAALQAASDSPLAPV